MLSPVVGGSWWIDHTKGVTSMKKMRVRVMTAKGEREADALWSQGGLAVIKSGIAGYGITAVASGWAVVRSDLSPTDAVIMAGELLKLGDWTRTPQEMVADRDFYHAVWNLISRGRAHGVHGQSPETWRLALYASDCDPDIVQRLQADY